MQKTSTPELVMIPYFEQPVWHIGPLTIHAFGITVAVAIWLAFEIASRRFKALGLDAALGQQLGGWIVFGGILGAHLFSVLFYFPDKLRDDPWLLVRVWEDISSFGGMLGGIAAAALFFVIRRRDVDRQT
ncbi:MAG TPA: prolipoprotein diacylglyceryl transferase family protein, partial [Gemmatimonadaceae bacterium]